MKKALVAMSLDSREDGDSGYKWWHPQKPGY